METKKCKGCNIEFTTDSKQQVFCNKQCGKQYFNNKNRITTHEWGSLKNKKIAATEENRTNYKQLLNSHYTRNELKSTGLNTETMERFFKIFNIDCNIKLLNIVYSDNVWRGGITKFYDKTSCDTYKQFLLTKEINGYRTNEYIIKKLNIAEGTFNNYKNNKFSGLNDPIVCWEYSFYEQNNADTWIENIIKYKQTSKELEECLRKEAQKQKNIKIQQKLEIKQKQKELRLIRKKEKAVLKQQEKLKKQLLKINKPKKTYKTKIFRRNDDWTSWENYETRLRKRLSDPTEVAGMRLQDAVENNKFYHSQHDIGNIINLTCKTCKNSKPYYEFHFDQTSKQGRRIKTCKACTNIRANKHNKQVSKVKCADQFATQFIISIKRELSKKNGYYYEIPGKKIWQALPFTKEELINHVTSLMQPWMNWNNNRRATVGLKTWHLDHIMPKSTFNYNSVNDEEFKKCWSLTNLRPIEAVVNIIKSNHKSLDSLVSSCFKRAVVRKLGSKMWTNYFHYSHQEAIEYLSKQFSEGMTWYNHGKIWEIDHIIPKAALPYNDSTDENFKKLWSLENLRPLLLCENRSKSSKYKNKKYFINNPA